MKTSVVEERVLVLAPTRKDSEAICKVLGAVDIECLPFLQFSDMMPQLTEGAAALVISEESAVEYFQPLLKYILAQEVWSDLPIIVLSQSGVEAPKFAAILPNLGNVSVIERPVRISTLVSLIKSALRTRKRQYQVRSDIKLREANAQEFKRSEERLRLALQTGNLGVWELNLASKELTCSRLCKAQFGYSPADTFTYSDLVKRIDAEDLSKLFSAFEHSAACGEVYELEFRSHWLDGSSHWILARGRVMESNSKSALNMIGVTMDITERKSVDEQKLKILEAERFARAEAERAGRMKDEFLATISHEIRTPLNAILGWAQLLKRNTPKTDFSEGLNIIERNAHAQKHIIEDLLDMSRIISGKVTLEFQRIDLLASVRAAIDTVKPTAEAKNVRIDSELGGGSQWVTGDPNRLHQVFWNLLTNAIKFTPSGGQIEVKCCDNVNLEVKVSDSGEGILPSFLPFIFDRFSQADASTTRKHGGLGLGLAIVKQLTELHGGSVQVHSDGLGKGTSFTVLFPKRDQIQKSHPDMRDSTEFGSKLKLTNDVIAKIDGMKILVVDDDSDSRELIRKVLEEYSASVQTAASSDEAMKIISNGNLDLLISDIGMPEKDGYMLIKQLRSLPDSSGGNTPAIAITAYARNEDREKAISAGFQRHLSKPLDPIGLIEAAASFG